MSPDSPAAQLGLNQEEIKELLEEQERWDREYQQELEEEERARVSAQHQEQEQHQDEARWVPTPPIGDSKPEPQTYKTSHEGSEDAESLYEDSWLNPELAPRLLYQPPSPILTTRYPPLPNNNSTYNMMDECDDQVATAEGNTFDTDNANDEPNHDTMIEQLTLEHITSDNLRRSCCEYTDIFPFSSLIIYSLNYFPDIFTIYLFKPYYLEVTDIFLHFSH